MSDDAPVPDLTVARPIVIGGEWFAMWQSSTWNGLEPAFRNVVMAGLGLLLVHLPSPQWSPESQA